MPLMLIFLTALTFGVSTQIYLPTKWSTEMQEQPNTQPILKPFLQADLEASLDGISKGALTPEDSETTQSGVAVEVKGDVRANKDHTPSLSPEEETPVEEPDTPTEAEDQEPVEEVPSEATPTPTPEEAQKVAKLTVDSNVSFKVDPAGGPVTVHQEQLHEEGSSKAQIKLPEIKLPGVGGLTGNTSAAKKVTLKIGL